MSAMKRKNINGIIILLIIIAIITVVIVYINQNQIKNLSNKGNVKNEIVEENRPVEEFVQILEDGTKYNTSDKLKETKRFEDFEITNLQLTEKDNVTLLLGTITNVGKTKQGGYPINVKLVDKNGNEIITIAAIIGELEPGESTQLSTNVVENCANAYDFTISRR